jgi:arylsulfatase A-like enzyme
VPTLAERLAPHGGAIVYNNVSPGAAYAHDPDGHGHVYHRAGSFAPGRVVLDPLNVALDTAGDRAVTQRFIADALGERQPALAVLWLGEPDHIQHNAALGSPEHLAVLREADRHAGMVAAAVDRRRAAGDDVLLIVGSDHGHETVAGVVDIEAELLAAGLKAAADSNDVVAMSSGTSSLIYLHPDAEAHRDSLGQFLASQPWVGRVIDTANLGAIGQAPHNGLAFAVSLRADASANEFGVPGRSLAARPRWGKADRPGCGQHGGLGQFEQSPVLLIDGPGFTAGAGREAAAHVIDLAPTIMRHLGVPAPGMDGRPLQRAP